MLIDMYNLHEVFCTLQLWRELVAIVGTDSEEVASERWKMLIPKVYRLAKKEAES